MRLTFVCLALSLGTAAAAGCGGGGQSLDAQSYAADVCSLALSWNRASGQIKGFENGSVDQAAAAQSVVDAQSETVSFVSTIRALEEPTEATGKTAYASLQETADSLTEHSQAIRAEGGKLALGDQTAEEAAAAVQPQIDLILDDLRQSVTQLDVIAVDADLTAIVRADQSCQALGL